MLTFLLLGAGIGFVSGVSPGPVLTLVVSETLKGGWLRGAAVAAGPLLADGPIVLVALVLFDRLPAAAVPARWDHTRTCSGSWSADQPSCARSRAAGCPSSAFWLGTTPRSSARISDWRWRSTAGWVCYRGACIGACCSRRARSSPRTASCLSAGAKL